MKPWRPQASHLNLISCGDQYALAVKGWFVFHAAFLWKIKDSIDRSFMSKYGDGLPLMGKNVSGMIGSNVKENDQNIEMKDLIERSKMRCGACGSKIGSTILSNVLRKIRSRMPGDASIEWGDDAAILPRPPDGHVAVQTIDYFRAPSILQDPYLFGYITAVHAMSDCYAMNAEPSTALALAVLPFESESKTELDLHQMMTGSLDALSEADCKLVGGHTSEGGDMAMGFAVTGMAKEDKIWRKSGASEGNAAILVKPLGSGLILAAADQGLPVGQFIPDTLMAMRTSNRGAMRLLQDFTVTSCTDITGFGLLGHLLEVSDASSISFMLDPSSVPLLPGVMSCVSSGVTSSLRSQNMKRVEHGVDEIDTAQKIEIWEALIDPQTNGGLLVTIPCHEVEQCLRTLKNGGFPHASVIGQTGQSGRTGITFKNIYLK